MPTEEIPSESKLDDDYTLRIPEQVREQIDVRPGDEIRWTVTENDELEIEVIEQENGVFEDAETYSLGDVPDDPLGTDY